MKGLFSFALFQTNLSTLYFASIWVNSLCIYCNNVEKFIGSDKCIHACECMKFYTFCVFESEIYVCSEQTFSICLLLCDFGAYGWSRKLQNHRRACTYSFASYSIFCVCNFKEILSVMCTLYWCSIYTYRLLSWHMHCYTIVCLSSFRTVFNESLHYEMTIINYCHIFCMTCIYI